MKQFLLVAAIIISIFAMQCSKKKALLDDQLASKADTTQSKPEGKSFSSPESDMEQIFASILKPIYFAYDSYLLSDENRNQLAEIGRFLRKQTSVQLRIEGHCDERGSAEYNMALGQRRADEVKKYLVDYGIAPNRFTTVSWGEERPALEGNEESAWKQNRRAEFQRME